jgi:hypothetical protein
MSMFFIKNTGTRLQSYSQKVTQVTSSQNGENRELKKNWKKLEMATRSYYKATLCDVQ